jgi:hypothetical protein
MAKDFKGHFEPDDPRNVLWGAGGADWPTVPPFRLRLGIQTVPLPWRRFRRQGVLLEGDPSSTHDDVTWTGIAPFPTDVIGLWAWRHYDKPGQAVWWFIFINHTGHHEPLQVLDIFGVGPANKTVYVENTDWPYPTIPDPGTPFELWQVYFNETLPPDGWPPWT